MLVFVLSAYNIGYIVFVYGSLRASRTIHSDLVMSVLGTTLRCVDVLVSGIFVVLICLTRWLDQTPTSRIITRCTQDIQAGERNISLDAHMICSHVYSRWHYCGIFGLVGRHDHFHAHQVRLRHRCFSQRTASRPHYFCAGGLVWPDLHQGTIVRQA